MSESYEIPTYRQNELIHAEVHFRYAPGVERVIAYFRHQVNPYVHHALFGHVISQAGDDYVARLAGRATVIEEAYGEYCCESLCVELEGGEMISFESVPDIRFEIVPSDTAEAREQPISNEPALVDWRWE